MVHMCNLSTWEVKARLFKVLGQSGATWQDPEGNDKTEEKELEDRKKNENVSHV